MSRVTSSVRSRYNLKDFVEQILERSFVEELNRTKDFGMFPLSKTAELGQALTSDEPAWGSSLMIGHKAH
jgi:hypothetical protein